MYQYVDDYDLTTTMYLTVCYVWHSDVRECLTGAHNCSQLCVELAGRYKCRCIDGYELADDQVTCNGTVSLANSV